MPEEDAHQRQPDEDGQRSSRPATPRHDWKDVFTLPRPLKDLFARFPLVTYPSNTLPARSLKKRDAHTLYIFTTDSDASNGAPSFNPSCLKWQVGRLQSERPEYFGPLTRAFVALPQATRRRFSSRSFEQSRLTHWGLAIPHPCPFYSVEGDTISDTV